MAWRQVSSQKNVKSMYSLALDLYPVPFPLRPANISYSPFPGSPTCRRRSTRIFFGSHLETNHSLYSVATNVLNLSDPLIATSFLSLWASCQTISLNKKHLGDNNRMSDRLRTHLIPRYIAETGVGVGAGTNKDLTEKDKMVSLKYWHLDVQHASESTNMSLGSSIFFNCW